MTVFDSFSKRQKRSRGKIPDVYAYDQLPTQFRVQVGYIISDAFGVDDEYCLGHALRAYKSVKETLCREFGLFELSKYKQSDADSIIEFFLQQENVEFALDVLELCFKVINGFFNNQSYLTHTKRKIEPKDAISELNERFKEHGIGYQFESNELIRIDSEFLHAEAVKPVLTVLREDGFKGANDEFLLAHEHYRHRRHKECLVDSLKAFESTMKAICKLRGWTPKPEDSASALIAVCFNNGLIPPYFETQFCSLKSLLASGIPTVRNKNGGHGQGSDVVVVPEYLARYGLNLTASSILFLVDAHTATK
jgi:hypothetical protein